MKAYISVKMRPLPLVAPLFGRVEADTINHHSPSIEFVLAAFGEVVAHVLCGSKVERISKAGIH